MSVPEHTRVWRRVLPAWVADYQSIWLRDDVIAGLTLAVMVVPQGMAYASLAGMPPITGLYSALVALLAYAALGTSSHLSFGPFALVSLLSAAAVEPLAGGQPTRYVALAGVLAIMVGLMHLLLAAARAGAIISLISHPVVVGFTTAVGVVIGLSQAGDLMGVDVPRAERFTDAFTAAIEAIPRAHPATLVVGVVAFALLLLGKRSASRVPAALVVVVVAIAAAVTTDLERRGVALVGSIPAGLPSVRIPPVTLDDMRSLVPSAGVLAAICFVGNMSMAKSIAARTRERLDPRRELVASGVANLASGAVGGFPVSASFTRTIVVYNAGARTQLAGVVASFVLVLTLAVLTPVLEPLPRTVLAAIVIVAVIGLVDLRSARAILRTDRSDGGVMVVTAVATLAAGVERGLLIGVATNLAFHLARRMRPALVVLGRVKGTTSYRNVARYPTVTDSAGVILRLDGALDFLSVEHVTGRIHELATERPEVSWIILVASGVTAMDTTGIRALCDIQHHLHSAGVALHLATLRGEQRDAVERAGLWSQLVAGSCHADVASALAAAGVPADAPVATPQPGERRPQSLL